MVYHPGYNKFKLILQERALQRLTLLELTPQLLRHQFGPLELFLQFVEAGLEVFDPLLVVFLGWGKIEKLLNIPFYI